MMDFDIFDTAPGIAEAQKAELKKQHELYKDKAGIYKTLFGTEQGQYVLNDLIELFIISPRFAVNMEYKECVKMGLIREGQALAVKYIQDLINFKEKEEN